MVAFTRFLLLNLFHLLSHVYADEESTSKAVKWLEAERSLLVHLATPDRSFWNQRDQVATHSPGAFIFNFTLTPDNLTLLLNDEPILPRAHPYIPARLRAPQTGESATDFIHRGSTNVAEAEPFVMDLDYYIDTSDTTSETSIYNTKYNPFLQIDILRANMLTYPGYSTPLDSNHQHRIWVWLEDISEQPPDTPYSNIPLRISRVAVSRRWHWVNVPTLGKPTYKAPKDLKKCNIWSWLCADIEEYPYYQYIYQENFDQYGRKGSMRHFLTTRWANMVALMGIGQAMVLVAICGSMVLSPFVYVIYRGVKCVFDVYRNRMQEVDEWIADEEVEGLLMHDRFFDDFGTVETEEVGKDDVAEGNMSERSSMEESLPPPPYTP